MHVKVIKDCTQSGVLYLLLVKSDLLKLIMIKKCVYIHGNVIETK